MARPKTPDGRRVPVSFKLTEAEAAMIDSLRGGTKRSVWLRDAALQAARKERAARLARHYERAQHWGGVEDAARMHEAEKRARDSPLPPPRTTA